MCCDLLEVVAAIKRCIYAFVRHARASASLNLRGFFSFRVGKRKVAAEQPHVLISMDEFGKALIY